MQIVVSYAKYVVELEVYVHSTRNKEGGGNGFKTWLTAPEEMDGCQESNEGSGPDHLRWSRGSASRDW